MAGYHVLWRLKAYHSSPAARSAISDSRRSRNSSPRCPARRRTIWACPTPTFFITDTLLIFDHLERRIKIVANAHVTDPTHADRAYDEAVEKIAELEARLSRAVPVRLLPVFDDVQPLEPSINMTRDQYVKMTEAMQEYIRAGDIFPGRAVAAVRGAVRCLAGRSLPRAKADQSVALHVHSQARRHGAGRLVAGAARPL